MSLGKTITLSNGSKIPQIGLGTWLSKPNEVENAVSYCGLLLRWKLTIGDLFVQVEIAVRNGYRHLDLGWCIRISTKSVQP